MTCFVSGTCLTSVGICDVSLQDAGACRYPVLSTTGLNGHHDYEVVSQGDVVLRVWLGGEEFWGHQGRVARINAGPWAGRYVLIYPEYVGDWWGMVIAPTPTPGSPGNLYIDDGSYLEERASEWQFEWIPRGLDEEALERQFFGWRPLWEPNQKKRRWKL